MKFGRKLSLKSAISSIVIAVILTAALLWFPILAKTSEGEDEDMGASLYAQSAVLMDADSGRVLFEKNGGEQRPMASTTKIMTCILALEYGDMDDVVTVTKNAASQPKVHLGVYSGETFYLKDLLYSLMLESHNDAAVAIAEHIGGSVEGFAQMMNQKARDIGCANTYFITPNGLDAEEADESGEQRIHSTTAKELAKIMRYCITQSPKKDDFLEITRTQNHYFTDIEGKHSFNCSNHNAFLTMMSGALSGKTGFTGGAGYSYVGALRDGDRTFIVALLGCGWPPHKTYKWTDTRRLMNFGLDNYEYREVWRDFDFPAIPVKDAVPVGENKDGTVQMDVGIAADEGGRSLKLLLGEEEQVEVKCRIESELSAPVAKGDVVGTVVYSLNGDVVKVYPVIASGSADKITLRWCAGQIAAAFLLRGDQ